MTIVWVDHRVDWWSFGILIYELLYGFTPFRGKKRDETFNNILKRPLNFPEQPEVSEACKVRRGLLSWPGLSCSRSRIRQVRECLQWPFSD